MEEEYQVIDTEEDEQWSDTGAVCPYCGYIHKYEDLESSLYSEDLETECSACGRKFYSSCYTSYSWTTKKI